MKASNYDWSKFTKRIGIKTTTDKIFESWTTRAGIESWFLAMAEFKDKNGVVRGDREKVEVGDSFTWMWLIADEVEKGTVLEMVPGKSISFTFLGCHVKVSIYEEAGESIAEVVQSGIPTDDTSKYKIFLDCTEGWTFYLSNLKAVLESGLDLRNRNEKLKRVINT